jgi:putative nucleotidyltransferase with HDIG domain
MLLWTEKKQKPAVREKLPFWSREIHFSPSLIVIVSILLIFVMLLLEVGPSVSKILGLIIFLAIGLAGFLIYLKKEAPELVKDNDAMMLLGLIAVISVMVIESIKSIPTVSAFLIPISGMVVLTSLLLGRHIALILALTISFICVLVNEFKFEYMYFHFLSSLAAVLLQENIKHRQDIIHVGLKVALINIVSIAVLTLFTYLETSALSVNLLWAVANGILLIVVVLIMLTPSEVFFSRITNIKLLELADFNQPLLKRLVLEAPGTYHHSLTVASIAEHAGEYVNANTLLIRVGAYYHDIGKLVKPEYFIENQIAVGNPHDSISPSMSGLIVISHIKEGVNLARKYKLDKPIIDLVKQHHGSSLMYLLYQKALEQDKKLSEDNFRYPGPKPKTRESAILMLADSCEAASRTLEEATPSKLKNLVEKIMNNRFTDGQLSDSPLTLSDLNKIAQSIVESLSGIHHARIEYKSVEKLTPAKEQKQNEK